MKLLPQNQKQYWNERIMMAIITIVLQVIAIVLIILK